MSRRRSSLAIQAFHAATGSAALRLRPTEAAPLSFSCDPVRPRCVAAPSAIIDGTARQTRRPRLPTMPPGRAGAAAPASSGACAAGKALPKTVAD